MMVYSLNEVEVLQVNPQSDLFQTALNIEFCVFQHEGFLDCGDEQAKRLQGYCKYDDNSIFNLAFLKDSPIATLREIHCDQRNYQSFKTINDFPESKTFINSIPAKNIVEIGTVAILPKYRGTLLAFLLYHQILRNDKAVWIASMDERLVKIYKNRFKLPFEQIGNTKFYMGSQTTPVALFTERSMKFLKENEPKMYKYIILGELT